MHTGVVVVVVGGTKRRHYWWQHLHITTGHGRALLLLLHRVQRKVRDVPAGETPRAEHGDLMGEGACPELTDCGHEWVAEPVTRGQSQVQPVAAAHGANTKAKTKVPPCSHAQRLRQLRIRK
jgi:hypothetical protein